MLYHWNIYRYSLTTKSYVNDREKSAGLVWYILYMRIQNDTLLRAETERCVMMQNRRRVINVKVANVVAGGAFYNDLIRDSWRLYFLPITAGSDANFAAQIRVNWRELNRRVIAVSKDPWFFFFRTPAFIASRNNPAPFHLRFRRALLISSELFAWRARARFYNSYVGGDGSNGGNPQRGALG